MGREHFGETVVGQIRSGGERRRNIRDADPAERAVLPSHFDPGLDHLRERRFNTACRDGVERRHQPTGPHLVDDGRGKSAHPLRLGGLGPHEFAHPTGQPDNPVSGFGNRRHSRFPSLITASPRQPDTESLDPKACRTTLLGVRHRPSPVHRRAAPLGDRTHQRLNQPLPPPQPAPRSHLHRPPRLPHPQPDPPTTPPTRPIPVVDTP